MLEKANLKSKNERCSVFGVACGGRHHQSPRSPGRQTAVDPEPTVPDVSGVVASRRSSPLTQTHILWEALVLHHQDQPTYWYPQHAPHTQRGTIYINYNMIITAVPLSLWLGHTLGQEVIAAEVEQPLRGHGMESHMSVLIVASKGCMPFQTSLVLYFSL